MGVYLDAKKCTIRRKIHITPDLHSLMRFIFRRDLTEAVKCWKCIYGNDACKLSSLKRVGVAGTVEYS